MNSKEGLIDASVVKKFWEKVQRSEKSGCWTWAGSTDQEGFGRIRVKSAEKRVDLIAHRVSWFIHRGPVPEGMSVLHSCGNRGCVNPDHLLLGSRKDISRKVSEARKGSWK